MANFWRPRPRAWEVSTYRNINQLSTCHRFDDNEDITIDECSSNMYGSSSISRPLTSRTLPVKHHTSGSPASIPAHKSSAVVYNCRDLGNRHATVPLSSSYLPSSSEGGSENFTHGSHKKLVNADDLEFCAPTGVPRLDLAKIGVKTNRLNQIKKCWGENLDDVENSDPDPRHTPTPNTHPDIPKLRFPVNDKKITAECVSPPTSKKYSKRSTSSNFGGGGPAIDKISVPSINFRCQLVTNKPEDKNKCLTGALQANGTFTIWQLHGHGLRSKLLPFIELDCNRGDSVISPGDIRTGETISIPTHHCRNTLPLSLRGKEVKIKIISGPSIADFYEFEKAINRPCSFSLALLNDKNVYQY